MQSSVEIDNSVKVAVRIRPLNDDEISQDSGLFINTVPGQNQINAGPDTYFTFDHVFGPDCTQSDIYEGCVVNLVDATFEGFNSTILAYGQTGSGKTWTMGSSSDVKLTLDSIGIIPRVIRKLFSVVRQKEQEDTSSTYKIYVQFLEIYGEEMRDLLDHTRTSKVSIRESPDGEVFVSGAREELVSSYEQMMGALEEGSAHRITASTKMNQTSSRSHAIFTVFLEQTIHAGAPLIQNSDGSLDSPTSSLRKTLEGDDGAASDETAVALNKVSFGNHEVRKCKFRFVDLAGSERAKRTGAQGTQLKEGIDINKGLLALGNVISALGDDTKKGKVFVPYRDSKLTRILQDSLGGNSKTLMICCVSPAYINYSESVNALRYANRARNIKNKPVVNRDPTLIVIDELKVLLKAVASELLEMRIKRQYIESDSGVSIKVLENCANAVSSGAPGAAPRSSAAELPPSGSHSRGAAQTKETTNTASATRRMAGGDSAQLRKALEEVAALKSRVGDGDFEIQRLNAQLKLARQAASDSGDSVLFARSERDFYKMKWAEACPLEAANLESLSSSGAIGGAETGASSALDEKQEVSGVMLQYLREIESLKQQIAAERSRSTFPASDDLSLNSSGGSRLPTVPEAKEFAVDEEFTSSIAALISQTREQLREESRRLKGIEQQAAGDCESDEEGRAARAEASDLMDTSVNDVDEDRAFVRRQKMLTNEVTELGQSILLKEQLVSQLTRSQHQYGAMKAFYEQKLTALSSEMSEKQAARDSLESELQNIAEEKHEVLAMKEAREKKLREELRHKDEELKQLKRKQDELHQLSQSQSRYMQQQAKLEADISSMKKQRVDLTRTLQSEKKSHMLDLGNKVKEIERLKRDLHRSTAEIKKLGRDKELAENKAREAMREGAALKKRAQEMQKGGADSSVSSARAAVRAMTKVTRLTANGGAHRILSDEEMRTKRWLDKRVSEISLREAAAESLKKQYEAQLELLNKRDALEQERSLALSNNEKDGSDSTNDRVAEVEEQLAQVSALVAKKTQQIEDQQRQIENAGDVVGSEKTLEVLKRSAASSLPAAHDVIRLLFDMLVQSSRTAHEKSQQVDVHKASERRLRQEVDEAFSALDSERRGRDMDLTRAAHEYEQNLSSLFSNMASLSPALLQTSAPLSPFKDSSASALDPTKLQLAISSEESKFLRSQLQRQSLKSSQIQTKLLDTEKLRSKLQKELDEKDAQIRFLEEERSLFRDLADDLKIGLNSLGKPGKQIVDSVRDTAAHKRKSGAGLFSEYMRMSEQDDNESDSESVLGEFDFLADEIFRTGGIQAYTGEGGSKGAKASGAPHGHNNALDTHQSSSSKAVVYDRLTNPSNFTGHMKNVFNKDIEEKRRRIKDSRTHERVVAAQAHKKDFLFISTNNTSNVTAPVLHSTTSNGGSSTTKNETLSKRASIGSESKFFGESSTAEHTAHSMSMDSEEGSRLQLSVSMEESGMPGSGPIPNVFSRLSKKFTGIHKHRNAMDDMHIASHSAPSTINSTTGFGRSNSPFTQTGGGPSFAEANPMSAVVSRSRASFSPKNKSPLAGSGVAAASYEDSQPLSVLSSVSADEPRSSAGDLVQSPAAEIDQQ